MYCVLALLFHSRLFVVNGLVGSVVDASYFHSKVPAYVISDLLEISFWTELGIGLNEM